MRRALFLLAVLAGVTPALAGWPVKSVLLSQPPYDPAATDYFTRLRLSGCGELDSRSKHAVSDFIRAERALGHWGTQDMLYLLTGTQCVASVNLAQPGTYTVTWSGTCTFARGFSGDGATCNGDTGVNVSALGRASQNDAHYLVATGTSASSILGVSGSLGTFALTIAAGAGNKINNLMGTTSLTDTAGGGAGCHWGDRSAAGTVSTGKDATTQSNAVANTSAAGTASHLLIGKRNTSFLPAGANVQLIEVGRAITVSKEPQHCINIRQLVIATGGKGL
jgi:hypothetical protein